MITQQASFFEPKPTPAPDLSKCHLIYTPKGRAREYARLACNVYRGCGHGCVYCYAPSATFKSPDEFYQPNTRGDRFLDNLKREAAKYAAAGVTDQVLLSFTCDPYQPLDTTERVTRRAIEILHANGLRVCTLTKGGKRALIDLEVFRPGDAFATTMTLLDPDDSAKWEPNAASPAQRIAAIRKFHAAGIPTWVSLEPVLDPAVALEIIRQTHEFVDVYKVGKLNYHPLAKSIDWRAFCTDAMSLLISLGYLRELEPDYIQDIPWGDKAFYVKDDLRAYALDNRAR